MLDDLPTQSRRLAEALEAHQHAIHIPGKFVGVLVVAVPAGSGRPKTAKPIPENLMRIGVDSPSPAVDEQELMQLIKGCEMCTVGTPMRAARATCDSGGRGRNSTPQSRAECAFS